MDFSDIMELRQPQYQSDICLVGVDGNAYAIMGTVQRGLIRAGAPKEYIAKVINDMQSSDYDHLLAVAVRYTKNDGMGA